MASMGQMAPAGHVHLPLSGRGGPKAPSLPLPARPQRPSSCALRCQSLFGLFSKPAREVPQEDAAGGVLRTWLEAQGLPPQKVVVANDPATSGRALFAVAPIAQGSPVLHVPGSLLLTPDAAAAQSQLVAALLQQRALPAWSVLAVWLSEARAAGPAHSWACYVEVLPAATGCVLEWSGEEVGWLRGSHLHDLALEIHSAARSSWEELQPLLAGAEAQGLAPPGALSREALNWAFAVLLTRLVRLPALADAEALVPWADFCNHSCDATTHLDWSPSSQGVVLAADRQYQPGEQVWVSYGEKTSGELLLSYGFLPEAGANPHDACLLRMRLQTAERPGQGWKQEVLQSWGFTSTQVFPLRMGALPAGLLQFASLDSAPDFDSYTHARRLIEAGGEGGSGGGSEADGVAGEIYASALQAVVERCQQALVGYAAPLDANKAELAGLVQRGGASGAQQGAGRRQQVLQLLVGEQQVLSRTVFLLQQLLRQLKRGR